MGWYIVCPFYKADSRLSISCEDCLRQFFSKSEKVNYIKHYCESIDNWEKCPYAHRLLDLYEEYEGMTKEEKEIRRLRHIAGVKDEENEKLRLQYGHLNAKIKSLEMLCGYLAGISLDFNEKNDAKIDVKKMCDFFGKFEIDWKNSNGEFITVSRRRKKST